ncbi:MAG: HlyD family type I secretion periplasmic adaptor subunit [Hyphomicrobiales bacterium]|nr:HlyD family type I secretion periplasmic adaptor subunit [Hyphomicrobiales bacterium]
MSQELVTLSHNPVALSETDGSRRYYRSGLLVLLLLVGGLGSWSVLADLSGAVIAPGKVTVESSRKTVQHLDGGIVSAILVRPGDRVEPGQVLVRLDETIDRANHQAVTSQLDELRARRARLLAEGEDAEKISFPAAFAPRQREPELRRAMRGQQTLFRTRREARAGQMALLRQRIARFEQEILGLEAQRRAEERQIALLSKELSSLRKLHRKGHARITRILALEREQARIASTVAGRDAEIARARNGIDEIKLQIIQAGRDLRQEVATELRQVESQIAVLDKRLIAARERYKRVDIRAAQAGTVLSLKVHTVGGVVQPGDTILEIVPDGDDLIVEAQVPVEDVDRISTGMISTVRFSALDPQTTPELSGKVTWVSADSIVDERTDTSHYLARIQVAKDVAAEDIALVPGMPAEVFINTGERSPISFFLKPLTDRLARSFRES